MSAACLAGGAQSHKLTMRVVGPEPSLVTIEAGTVCQQVGGVGPVQVLPAHGAQQVVFPDTQAETGGVFGEDVAAARLVESDGAVKVEENSLDH